MEVSIKAGSKGEVAFVDSNERLHVASISESQGTNAASSGIEQKFNCNTGTVTLTDANKTSMLYMENTGTYDMVCTAFIYNFGASTSGSGDATMEILKNITSGDILSNTNDVAVGPGLGANSTVGSSNNPSGKFYKGATSEGVTTGGLLHLTTLFSSALGRNTIPLVIVIPKGGNICVEYTPQTSNSSQGVQVAVSYYVKTPEVAV